MRGLFLIDKAGIVRHSVVNDLPLGRSISEVLRMVDALQHFEQNGEVCPANWAEGRAGHDAQRQRPEGLFRGEALAPSSQGQGERGHGASKNRPQPLFPGCWLTPLPLSPYPWLLMLLAVFGHPVAENPTQVMMEAAFAALGLDWRYLTIEVLPAGLADAVRGARAMGFRGFNCTIPHKVAVVGLLDELTPAAQAIGAVNCVAIQDGRLLGENTDGKGFLESVQALGPVAGKSAVMFGAGGAARAIGVELLLAGLGKLTVVNRSPERGGDLLAVLDRAAAGKASLEPWAGDHRIPRRDRLRHQRHLRGIASGSGGPAAAGSLRRSRPPWWYAT